MCAESSGHVEQQVLGRLSELHIKQLHNLKSLRDIIKMFKWKGFRETGRLAWMVRWEKLTKFYLKIRKERQFGVRKHRWKDNIKVDIEGIEPVNVGWIELPQDSLQWQ